MRRAKRALGLLRLRTLGPLLVGVLVFAVVALVLAWWLAPEQLPSEPQLSTSFGSLQPHAEPPRPSATYGVQDNLPRATPPRDSQTNPPQANEPQADEAPPSATEPVTPERLLISAIGVDAPLTRRGLDADGAMQLPSGPEDVAWYDFTASPGEGSNVVLSGHLDYRGYGPAVFYKLRDLTPGDIIELRTDDGESHRYAVSATVTYDAGEAPVADIVGETSREVVTLITCGGTFNGTPLGYSHRLVVRAEHL